MEAIFLDLVGILVPLKTQLVDQKALDRMKITKERLQTLKNHGVKLFIVSTDNRNYVQRMLRRYYGDGLIDEIYCAESPIERAVRIRKVIHGKELDPKKVVVWGRNSEDRIVSNMAEVRFIYTPALIPKTRKQIQLSATRRVALEKLPVEQLIGHPSFRSIRERMRKRV